MMNHRAQTEEELEFCGCIYTLSFLREQRLQKAILQAIHQGFPEWLEFISQLNGYRGLPSFSFSGYVFSLV